VEEGVRRRGGYPAGRGRAFLPDAKGYANPNRIVHFSVWTSLADAQRFFDSPELVRIRAEAGVKSPEFNYLEELEAGTL